MCKCRFDTVPIFDGKMVQYKEKSKIFENVVIRRQQILFIS